MGVAFSCLSLFQGCEGTWADEGCISNCNTFSKILMVSELCKSANRKHRHDSYCQDLTAVLFAFQSVVF